MKNCISTLCFLYAIGCQLPAVAQDSIRVKLNMSATVVNIPPDTRFDMTIELLTDRPIVLPHVDHWGSPEDTTNYIYYIIERNTEKGYDYYPKSRQPEDLNPPGYRRIPDTLTRNNPIKKNEEFLSSFYTFPKGSYRARVLYHSTVFNPQNIYSNWVYFTVKEDIR